MKMVKGLDGKQYKFNLHGHSKKLQNKSEPHLAARALLQELFPQTSILEEVPLPSTRLIVDFYLPSYNLMVEVNGRQHSEYIPHFHGSEDEGGRMKFYQGKKRDRLKREWCEINNITLVSLEYNERENWKTRLLGN